MGVFSFGQFQESTAETGMSASAAENLPAPVLPAGQFAHCLKAVDLVHPLLLRALLLFLTVLASTKTSSGVRTD
jgi:hypothetical protein